MLISSAGERSSGGDASGDDVVVAVEDNGPGMSAEVLDQVGPNEAVGPGHFEAELVTVQVVAWRHLPEHHCVMSSGGIIGISPQPKGIINRQNLRGREIPRFEGG